MSIYTVAAAAGVSPATVSRFLNGSAYVAPDKARQIQEAITRLGYAPRAVRPGPRTLHRRGVRTGHVALLGLGEISPVSMYRMPAFPRLLGAVQESLDRAGMDLVLTRWAPDVAISPMLTRGQLDGILVHGRLQPMPEKLMEILRQTAAVWFFREHADPRGELDHVFYDNSHIGGMAAQYLLERGHRHLAFVSSARHHAAFAARRETFLEALADKVGEVPVLEGRPGTTTDEIVDEVMRLAKALLALKPRPTGIFVASDDAMLTLFNCLQLAGLRPGRDLELIGCNNDPPYISQMRPRPATIDIKLDIVGQRAVEQLLWRMNHRNEESRSEVLVKPVLIAPEF